jgi:hypothetical protein
MRRRDPLVLFVAVLALACAVLVVLLIVESFRQTLP